jgi:hypothetical protein
MFPAANLIAFGFLFALLCNIKDPAKEGGKS